VLSWWNARKIWAKYHPAIKEFTLVSYAQIVNTSTPMRLIVKSLPLAAISLNAPPEDGLGSGRLGSNFGRSAG
jgi:hypothetical protein